MSEYLQFHERMYPLQFEKGWDELAIGRYGPKYQDWFAHRVQETQFTLQDSLIAPGWAFEYHVVAYRWQQAVEFVAKHGMSWDANPATSQCDRLEKAINKLQKHLAEPEAWQTPAISFYLPKRHPLDSRSDKVVDIRTLRSPRQKGPRRLQSEGYLIAEGAKDIAPDSKYL